MKNSYKFKKIATSIENVRKQNDCKEDLEDYKSEKTEFMNTTNLNDKRKLIPLILKLKQLKETLIQNKIQNITFALIFLTIMAVTTIVCLIKPFIFQKFLGPINPILFIPLLAGIAIILLNILISHEWFNIINKGTLRGLLIAFVCASFLVLDVIFIDVAFKYPQDINILLPYSILFYPAIAFVVELLFHIIPLSLLIILFTKIFKTKDSRKVIFMSIFIVSILESVYQLLYGTPGYFPLWIVIAFGIHIFSLNFIQLTLFKKYNFFTMFAFRLIYYLFWHILWGSLRLELLF
jgi:hypothetical protein